MSLGSDEYRRFTLNDTANLTAVLYDDYDQPILSGDITSVSFVVQKPDRTRSTLVGSVASDGTATARFSNTDQVGQYLVAATFTLVDGSIQTPTPHSFDIIDPFDQSSPSVSWYIADAAWKKIEDCFDSEDEGPWLTDMTLNLFNRDKMETFINEALLDINLQHPLTQLVIGDFVHIVTEGTEEVAMADATFPLLVQGVFLAVVRHLMRSYTEQPNPVGAPIAWHDRRDYLQRWQTIYQIEREHYLRMLALFKRQYLGIGRSALLLGSKAGRLVGAPMRTRFAGRGYW